MPLEVKSVADPIVLPETIGLEGAELAEGVSVSSGPPKTCFWDTRLKDVPVTAFVQAGADGQIEGEGVGEGVGVGALISTIAAVSQRGLHGSFCVRHLCGLLTGAGAW